MPRGHTDGYCGAIHGEVSRGFELVRATFAENFRVRGECGAAVAVYKDGRKVVDLWGGARDSETGEPWQEDTLVMVFSSTKGMAAMALAVAHSRGLIEFDERVANYWPEFSRAGKGNVTVRQLLAHQAGLSAIDVPLDLDLLADHDALAEVLAAQAPAWDPGARCGYHAISLGFYESELIRRVDPKGRTLGQFFKDEIAGPLDLEFYIGLPAEVPDSRLARIAGVSRRELLRNARQLPWKFAVDMGLKKGSLAARSFSNPQADDMASDRRYTEVEVPAVTGVGEARGDRPGLRGLRDGWGQSWTSAAAPSMRSRPPRSHPRSAAAISCSTTTRPTRSASASRAWTSASVLAAARSGTPGAGGSFGFADPETGIGFAYTMNRMGLRLFDDPREEGAARRRLSLLAISVGTLRQARAMCSRRLRLPLASGRRPVAGVQSCSARWRCLRISRAFAPFRLDRTPSYVLRCGASRPSEPRGAGHGARPGDRARTPFPPVQLLLHPAEGEDMTAPWITYRPEIKVLDCTIRDGGLINDHMFDDGLVKAVYDTCVEAGVDYMEIGYKGSKELFARGKFGDWKWCDEDDMRRIVGRQPVEPQALGDGRCREVRLQGGHPPQEGQRPST